MQHVIERRVSFGDCDPAGIVFYPNMFAWMDACFHDRLRLAGGHGAICAALGAKGLGLMSAEAKFRRPMRENDRVEIALVSAEWGAKTLALDYELRVDGAVAAAGREVRGVFVPTGEGLRAGEMAPLRAMLEGGADG